MKNGFLSVPDVAIYVDKVLIPKPTEDTITDILKGELEKRGLKCETFPVLSTPEGIRKPDIYVQDYGRYIAEAKFRDLMSAVRKIYDDYLKHYAYLSLRGGFGLLYPEELAQTLPIERVKELVYRLRFKAVGIFAPGDPRPFTVYEGSLVELAGWISELALRPEVKIEPNTDYLISTLRDASTYLLASLAHLTGEQLEDVFGGKSVFRNILQYEAEEYPVEEMRRATAYLLINQLLFYHVLSIHRPRDFPIIDENKISKPSELNEWFKGALRINYSAVFTFDVASRIKDEHIDLVRNVVKTIKGLTPEKIRFDILGQIFHDLIPFEIRKGVAAFYTNTMAAEMLAWLAIDDSNARVTDFAVGSGGILVAAYRRKRHLLERQRSFTERDHKRFVEKDLLGVDVMPFAAHLAAINEALQEPQYRTDKVRIAVWDSAVLRPGTTVPSIAVLERIYGKVLLDDFIKPKPEEKEKAGVVTFEGLGGEPIELSTYDVVIMNPPFTRQERMPEIYKKVLNSRFAEYGKYLHGMLGYYGYFVLLADRFLAEGGRMALVLPATVLRIKSCEGLRRLWQQRYHIEYIISTWLRSAFSESVRFREILLVARKLKEKEVASATSIAILKKLPARAEEARTLAELLKRTEKNWEDERIVTRVVHPSEFSQSYRNWFKYMALSDPNLFDILTELTKSPKLVSMASVAEAKRIDLEHVRYKDFHGFILFDQARAEKKIDVWVAYPKGNRLIAKHRFLGHEIEVPKSSLKRGLRRLSYVKTMDITESSDYLITSWFSEIRDLAKGVLTKGLREGIVMKWRDKFYERKSKLLLARRFDISAPGTSHIAFFSSEPLVGIDMWCIRFKPQFRRQEEDYAKILVLWLNSSINLLQLLAFRTETRGAWMKVHEYMLEETVVPDFAKMDETGRSMLLGLFNEVSSREMPSLLDQLSDGHSARKKIDEAFLKILGYEGDPDKLLNDLYVSLRNEIQLLRTLMYEEIEAEQE